MKIRLLAAPYDSAIIKKAGLSASVLRCAVAHMLRGQGHKVTEAETIVHSTYPTEVTTSCAVAVAVAEAKKQGVFPIVFLEVVIRSIKGRGWPSGRCGRARSIVPRAT